MYSALENESRRACGAMIAYQAMLETVPSFRAQQLDINEHALQYAAGRVSRRSGLITIPTVVHVVYSTEEQNISDAQVQSQIDVLNADFRAENADITSVPGVWTSLAADAEIEFELATETVDGQSSNGITRTHTSKQGFKQAGDPVKFSAQGGVDAWDPSRFLNIWVCNLLDRLLGYAQFPGGPPDTDGVVVLHSAFGTVGSAKAPFDQGRTCTHEVGHYLNLFHIWGDTLDCSGSDHVSDTPRAQSPNYGIPAFPHISCGNGPSGDMFMNYMDYVDDVAMVMFTKGQVERMRATLSGVRSGLG